MTDEPIKAGKLKKEAAKMTFGLIFLSLLYQNSQVVEFTGKVVGVSDGRNRVPFNTDAEAQTAGFRKEKDCPQ